MNKIPSVQDWLTDPDAASLAHSELVNALNAANVDASPAAIGEGIGAAVLSNAAVIALASAAANAEAPGSGALVAAGMAVASSRLASQHAQALATLTSDEATLLTSTVTASATAIAAKNPEKP